MTTSDHSEGTDDLDRFRAYRRTGERALRNRLVEQHMALAEPHVRRFSGRGIPDDDLRQVGMLAVLSAVERFDPELGVSFATFAGRTIEGELKRQMRDRTWLVRPPRRRQELFLAVRRTEDELVQRLGRSPSVAEIAAAVGEPEDNVLEALEAGGARYGDSLDQPAPGQVAPRGSRLASPGSDHGQAELRLLVGELLDGLDEREREVIELRFFEELGQPEIAERLGISQSYVSRLIRRVLTSLGEQL